MYQLQVSIHETVGAYVCHASISSSEQDGRVVQIASTVNSFIEHDDPWLDDDLTNILRAAERYVRLLVESPKH